MLNRALAAASTLALALPLALSAQDGPLSSSLRQVHELTKAPILQTAERVPEELFAFRPTDEVRTLGQILAHIADAQFMICSIVAGEENPNGERLEETRTTKAQIGRALTESFRYCDGVYAGMSDAEGAGMRTVFGMEMAALAVLAFNTAHNQSHYGNLVTYMRINGIVPPSSGM